MRTTDNNGGRRLSEFANIEEKIADLTHIGNRSLIELQQENPDLLIFPHSFGYYHDDVEKPVIFGLDNEKLTTQNLMGFVGRNNTQLSIASRFANSDDKDYFIHYMLQKVFSINLLNFDQTPNKDNIWDFLLYLFPSHLKKACSQGIYKAYRIEEYNDCNIKGAIDVKRHLVQNNPFMGKVSYTTREHSYDNPITQLIRHTIEHIKIHPFGNGLLTHDSEMRDIVSRFIFITNKHYNKNVRQKVINANLKSISHPYFTEYTALQKLCLNILKHEKITFGKEKNKVYGLLFDGAWLWEEYLNTILKDDFIHPENKTGKHRFYLFKSESDSKVFQTIYPDFISKSINERPILVGDAKYIPLQQKSFSSESERATSIYYKTITYMYRFNSRNGFLLFPNPVANFCENYSILETNGHLRKIGLGIPKNSENFKEFKKLIEENEIILKKSLTQIF